MKTTVRALAALLVALSACKGTVSGTGGSSAGATSGSTSGAGSSTGSTSSSTSSTGSTGSGTTGSADVDGGTPLEFDPGPGEGVTMVQVGDHGLRVLSPTVLELWRINTKAPDPGTVDSWDFVDSASGTLNSSFPGPSAFSVTADGQSIAVTDTGFRRRPRYAPFSHRDLRIGNSIYLVLSTPLQDGAQVQVADATGALWPSGWTFSATVDPSRPSPVIHVNQFGYGTSFAKKGTVGFYLGSLGELPITATQFELVDARTGATAFSGNLTVRPDTGFNYTPTPYQLVYEADFTTFQTPGQYRLKVAGLGASDPFFIEEGMPAGYARMYALGLFHQRCGYAMGPPTTRFTHGADHTAKVRVIQASDTANWTFITNANQDYAQYQDPSTPRITDLNSMLYPFVNPGPLDVSGGHHDAGDYSKYTMNSAQLVSILTFAVDALPGVAQLDNLGIPESGDHVSDLLEEAKWEADFLAKLQDGDGAFYFLVYPRDREYETNVTPDHGDGQLVWPKNTAATAAATAALAEIGSSPAMKAAYPQDAARYLAAAQKGWQFLMQAIAAHGKAGAYQKLTHYGNQFTHDDELAWAASALYAATGDSQYSTQLYSWLPDPSSPDIRLWGWVRMFEGWGGAIRDCAFAARTGRPGAFDAAYEQKCEAEAIAAGDDQLTRSDDSAYGTSFPLESKAYMAAGWYLSSDQAFDLAVAWALNQNPRYLDAMVENLSYEMGANPLNVSFLTGVGWKRQREIVHQWAENDERVLPPSGIPLGNLQSGPAWGGPYNGELGPLAFPEDGASSGPYPLYDRWADSFNVTTEFVNPQQARALSVSALLMSMTSEKDQAWPVVAGRISGVPSAMNLGDSVTASFDAPGLPLGDARIVWDGQDIEPGYGGSYALSPHDVGPQALEAEAIWPDGRRAVASASFTVHQQSVSGVPAVSVVASQPNASEAGPVNGEFTISRTGDTTGSLDVKFSLGGSAAYNWDYDAVNGNYVDQRLNTVTIPAGQASVTIPIRVLQDDYVEGDEQVLLTLTPDVAYTVGAPEQAAVTIADDDAP